MLIVGMTVLLAPVAAFMATAVRFGGEQQERRLAALRLIGADIRTVRYVAAGETVVASALGLASGVALFALLRPLAGRLQLGSLGVHPADVRPQPVLAALVLVMVPSAAVVVTLAALRSVSIEPLGVSRRAAPNPRRLWWRVVPPAVGLVLLLVFGTDGTSSSAEQLAIVAGSLLLVLGGTLLLPWVVELVTRRARGGSMAWQLAARRTQLSGGGASRAVSAVIAAVAGAIAIQVLVAGSLPAPGEPGGQPDLDGFDADLSVPLADVAGREDVVAAVESTPGVTSATGLIMTTALGSATGDGSDRKDAVAGSDVRIIVADCATLGEVAQLPACRSGSVFVADGEPFFEGQPVAATPSAGDRLHLAVADDQGSSSEPRAWSVPPAARPVELRDGYLADMAAGGGPVVLATPEGLDPALLARAEVAVWVHTATSGADRDEIERLRNTAAGLSPTGTAFTTLWPDDGTTERQLRVLVAAGMVATLVFAAGSLLVSTAEQLQERRRPLAVLAAFGARRSVMARSLLYQTAVPVVSGLAMATATGLLLGWALLRTGAERFQPDPIDIAVVLGVAIATVGLVVGLSIPLLWKLMRAENLRFE